MTWFMEGQLFYLRPVERADYTDHLLRWLNDREVTRYLTRGTFAYGSGALGAAFESMAASTTDLELTIVAREFDAPAGLVGLHAIAWVPRSAEFRILLGERSMWGKGIGTEATQLLVAYAFEVLNLNKVWLGVNAENSGAIATYERTGFVREGVLRQEVFRNGQYYDVVRMSMLRDDYDAAAPGWETHAELWEQLRGSR